MALTKPNRFVLPEPRKIAMTSVHVEADHAAQLLRVTHEGGQEQGHIQHICCRMCRNNPIQFGDEADFLTKYRFFAKLSCWAQRLPWPQLPARGDHQTHWSGAILELGPSGRASTLAPEKTQAPERQGWEVVNKSLRYIQDNHIYLCFYIHMLFFFFFLRFRLCALQGEVFPPPCLVE